MCNISHSPWYIIGAQKWQFPPSAFWSPWVMLFPIPVFAQMVTSLIWSAIGNWRWFPFSFCKSSEFIWSSGYSSTIWFLCSGFWKSGHCQSLLLLHVLSTLLTCPLTFWTTLTGETTTIRIMNYTSPPNVSSSLFVICLSYLSSLFCASNHWSPFSRCRFVYIF